MKSLFLMVGMTFFSFPIFGGDVGDVIDVGSLKIEGIARGPHGNAVDTNRLADEIAQKIVNRQLKALEEKLLSSGLETLTLKGSQP